MTKKIVVLGAGIAGCVALHALKGENVSIVEKAHMVDGFPVHSAVMRLRDSAVADLVGARVKRIQIEKGVWYKGRFCSAPTIKMNNMYSQKLYGTIGKRSILKPGNSTRYLIDRFPAPYSGALINKEVNAIYPRKIVCSDGTKIEYDYLVSTLPMPLMFNKLVGSPKDLKMKFKAQPVYTSRWPMLYPTGVHQTITFPDPELSIYRITLQDSIIIIESTEKFPAVSGFRNGDIFDEGCELLKKAFGIPATAYRVDATSKNKIDLGKIIPVDEDARLRYIMWLTDNYGIFSFGRFATWRPIRTDHLIQDIDIIKRIISAKSTSDTYHNRKVKL